MEISSIQKKVLELFKKSPLKNSFYWTGGTLLAGLYLHHRQSNDLDFFTDKLFSKKQVNQFISELKKEFKLKHVKEKKIFDRYEFLIHNKKKIRLEFVIYEYPALKKRKKWEGIFVDSLDDIAANKTMAFFDRNDPRARDTNQNQFSGANSGKIQGARSDAYLRRYVSDEQRRSLPEFARPKGSQKMDDFFVAPPRSVNLTLLRRPASKSSHFLASKLDSGSYPVPLDLFDIYFLLTKKKYSPKKLLNLVKKKFGVEFSESSFWSEGYKGFKELDNLKPLLLEKSQKQKNKLIKEIKEYFTNQSEKHLHQFLR